MTIDCKNNPNFFKELYDIDELVNIRYNNMLNEIIEHNHKISDSTVSSDNSNSNSNYNDNSNNSNSNLDKTDSTDLILTKQFITNNEKSLKETIFNKIIEEYFDNTLTIYLKKEIKKYNQSNFNKCELLDYLSLLYEVSINMGFKNEYKYLNNSIFIYLPNQLGSFINFNIETEDILNTIEIGYNILKTNIELSPDFGKNINTNDNTDNTNNNDTDNVDNVDNVDNIDIIDNVDNIDIIDNVNK